MQRDCFARGPQQKFPTNIPMVAKLFEKPTATRCRYDRGFQKPSKDWALEVKRKQTIPLSSFEPYKKSPRKKVDRASIFRLHCLVLLFTGEMLLLKSSNENISKF